MRKILRNACIRVAFYGKNTTAQLPQCSTWYRSIGQLPNFHDYDIKHGRTYMYFNGEPLYPFGYRLSYATFSYENLRVSDDRLSNGKPVTIMVDVSNMGHRDGDEVLQLYVHVARTDRPIKQLAGFERLALKPRQKRTATFQLSRDHIALQYWNETKHTYDYEPGIVKLMIGSSSADIRLQGQVILE